MTIPAASILEAMDHPAIWRGWFRDHATWQPWRTFLAVLFGLPLAKTGLALYRQCTGRNAPPPGGITEAWLIVGRRGGKSIILAMIACYLAIFRDWRQYLSPGEVGTIKVVATDRKQARVIHRYCRGLLTKVPAFAQLINRDTDDAIELTNGITIEIQTASFRSVRGFTIIACLCDEIAFWRSEETAANPDSEIISAIRPAMSTIHGAMLLCASSPYARRGELWNAYRRYHGQDDAPALVWQATTRTMNPTVPQAVIDEAIERDPSSASAEYGAEFRTDLESFVSREVVEAAIVPDRRELPQVHGIRYVGFADAAGGSGKDSFTAAVAHHDRPSGRIVLDALREHRPPFSPEAICEEYSAFFRGYGVRRIIGDRWGGEFPIDAFRKGGVECVVSERVKTDLYHELLPLLNSGKIELLDHPRLIAQLCGLERRTGRGKDIIDHAPGSHDDLVNVLAGAVVEAAARPGPIIISDAAMAKARIPSARILARRHGLDLDAHRRF